MKLIIIEDQCICFNADYYVEHHIFRSSISDSSEIKITLSSPEGNKTTCYNCESEEIAITTMKEITKQLKELQ